MFEPAIPFPRTMPLSLAFAEPSTFVVNASGEVTYEEVMELFEKILAHPRLGEGSDMLVDAEKVTGVPTTKELRVIARALRPLHVAGVSAMAIVTSSTFVYGIARMFSVLAESSGMRVSAFREMNEAQR